PRLAAGPRDAWPGVLSLRLLSTLAARILGSDRIALASDLRIGRTDQPGAGDLRDQWADLDRRPGLCARHTDRAERVDLRIADGHLPGRTATDPADVLRSCFDRRSFQMEAVSYCHEAAANADHLLHRRPESDQRNSDVHPVVHHFQWYGRPSRLDPVLYAVPLSRRIRPLQHGLCHGHGMAPLAHYRRNDGHQFLRLQILGVLR